jgi:hypothetical protein
MKPISPTTRNSRSLPLVEFHYQPGLLGYQPRCTKNVAPAFHKISSDYFHGEAHREFTTEAAVFGTLIMIAIVPITTGISAVAQLLRVLPLF